LGKLKPAPGIVPALDLGAEEAVSLAAKLSPMKEAITGFKIGSMPIFDAGLHICEKIKRASEGIPVILDQQKGASDIAEVVERQVEKAARHKVDAFIGSPFGAGIKTLDAFVRACKRYEVIPIVVVEMSHPGASHFLRVNACEELAELACRLGVPYVVAPASMPQRIAVYRRIFGKLNPSVEIMSPGVGPQRTGDPVRDAYEAVIAGADHVIAGRAIYASQDPLRVLKEMGEAIKRAYAERVGAK